MVALTAGLVCFTQVSVDGSYLGDLLPGFLLVGVGLGFSFVPISIAALAGVQRRRGGARVRPDQHVAADRRRARHRGALDDRDVAHHRRARSRDGRARGARRRLHGGVRRRRRIAALGIVAALTLIRRDELEPAVPEAQPALDLAA